MNAQEQTRQHNAIQSLKGWVKGETRAFAEEVVNTVEELSKAFDERIKAETETLKAADAVECGDRTQAVKDLTVILEGLSQHIVALEDDRRTIERLTFRQRFRWLFTGRPW